ncbi:MAG: formylglycine-generating enzyme family protein [Limisphaerales bacterium]
MHGNVFEWCHDWCGPRLSGGNIADPRGPVIGTERLLRGGCWIALGRHCRSVYRVFHLPSTRPDRDGFRVTLVRVR